MKRRNDGLIRVIVCVCSFYILTGAFVSGVGADELYLSNGDRLTGEIVSEKANAVTVNTEAMGTVTVVRDAIEKIVPEETAIEAARGAEPQKDDIEWTRTVSAGYTMSRGNTDNDSAYGEFLVNRNHVRHNEFTLKGRIFYSATNDTSDAEQWHLLGRYAYSFGPERAWYNFFRCGYDHDKFADIDYRIIPGAGIGYWLADTDAVKMMAEIAAGVEHAVYESEKDATTEAQLMPRAYVEMPVFRNATVSEDVIVHASLGDIGEYRLRSETKFTNPVTDALSLNLSLIDEYDSDPPDGTEENDLRLISSLEYSF